MAHYTPAVLWLLLSLTASAQTEVRCCDLPAAVDVVEGYLKLQSALAGRGSPSSTCYLFDGIVGRARRRAGWSAEDAAVLDELASTVGAVKNSREDKIRAAFPEMSRQLSFLVLAHESLDGEKILVEGSCDGHGPWWQERKGSEVRSPYPKATCRLR